MGGLVVVVVVVVALVVVVVVACWRTMARKRKCMGLQTPGSMLFSTARRRRLEEATCGNRVGRWTCRLCAARSSGHVVKGYRMKIFATRVVDLTESLMKTRWCLHRQKTTMIG